MPETGTMDSANFQSRLSDGIVSTLRARQSYFEPSEFRRNLNAAIEALRSSTWVLQKACKTKEGFDSWYEERQSEMREDPLMRWLVDSRNRVVKQGDLEGHSLARVTLYRGWYSEPFSETEVPPETKPHEYAQAIASCVPDFARTEECILRVERRWVHNLLPDQEVTEALEHCCRSLLKIHGAFIANFGGSISLELEAASESLMTAKRDWTGCWMKLQSGELSWSAMMPQELDPDCYEQARARYGASFEAEPFLDLQTPLQKQCANFFRAALTMLRVDKHALPFAFIVDGKGTLHQHGLLMRDRAEKHMVFRQIAERARQLGGRSVIIVNEAWMASATGPIMHAVHRKDRREALIVQGVDCYGECFSILQPFVRVEGSVFIPSNPSADTGLSNVMRPIYEALTAKRATRPQGESTHL